MLQNHKKLKLFPALGDPAWSRYPYLLQFYMEESSLRGRISQSWRQIKAVSASVVLRNINNSIIILFREKTTTTKKFNPARINKLSAGINYINWPSEVINIFKSVILPNSYCCFTPKWILFILADILLSLAGLNILL